MVVAANHDDKVELDERGWRYGQKHKVVAFMLKKYVSRLYQRDSAHRVRLVY